VLSRAVVWTDTLQFSAMIGAVLIVMVLGTIKIGGVGNVFEIAERSGRLVWFKFVENFVFLIQDIINLLLVWILIPLSVVQYGPCRLA
jgi:Na+/proline symporter